MLIGIAYSSKCAVLIEEPSAGIVSIEPLLMINTTPLLVAAELRFGGRDDLLLVLFSGIFDG